MAKKWILHTETKGTGAQMVPLESATKRSSATQPVFVPREPLRRVEPEAKPRAARSFKIVDVMTREPLLDGAGTRETVDALSQIRSIIDVNVYVWQDEDDSWRLLSLPEQRALWDLAHG
jgi:hypothetical protein